MPERPIRILHVVGGMDRGGVETWLMHVLRNIDRSQYQMDFLVHTEKHCAYDDEIRTLGSRIMPCLHPSRPLEYGRKLKRILREYGPYDVVHSHVHHFSGYVLWLAHQAGVKTLIAHSHSDTSRLQSAASFPRQAYLRIMKILMKRYATHLVGVSKQSTAALFGEDWQRDKRSQILYYGIDLSPFTQPIAKATVRSELGIPPNAFVVGHVGRFVDVKNHKFLIEVFHELANQNSNAHLLLIGDGALRPTLENQVMHLGLTDRVHFVGVRDDVPQLIRVIDVFAFPSFYEGLPLVLIEAQAGGLPCVVSDVISNEIELLKGMIYRLPLANSQKKWVATLSELGNSSPVLEQSLCIDTMQKSVFNLEHNLRVLLQQYRRVA